ncbi:TPA: hypothetical protein JV404_005202, partial [Escherichia coli]|nr:hypothetical protein [Escherichia coli]
TLLSGECRALDSHVTEVSSLTVSSPGTIEVGDLKEFSYPGTILHLWDFSKETQVEGCGFFCVKVNPPSSFRALQTTGRAVFTPVKEQSITLSDGSTAKVTITFSGLSFYGKLSDSTGRDFDTTTTGIQSDTETSYSFNSDNCSAGITCTYSFRTGIKSGTMGISISLPQYLKTKSFILKSMTVGEFQAKLYSQIVDASYVGSKEFVSTGELKIPNLTINIPERCYTYLSGNTITFRSDIDASLLTHDENIPLDSKSVLLTANCDARNLTKKVNVSARILPTNGTSVVDGYKFKLTPEKKDYITSWYLGVVAKHVSSGSTQTCGKDSNTFESGQLKDVGLVAFPGSLGGLSAPYPVTFNLCSFKASDTSSYNDALLTPGKHSGA